MKKLNFKKILATASAVAMIAGSSTSALAAERTTVAAGPSNLSTGANFDQTANADVAIQANRVLKLDHATTITVGGPLTVGAIKRNANITFVLENTAGNAGVSFTIGELLGTFTSTFQFYDDAASELILNNDVTQNFDFVTKTNAGADGTIKINDGVNIIGSIASSQSMAGTEKGIINFVGTGTVSGAIGATGKQVKVITLTGAAGKTVTLKDAVFAKDINFAGAGKLALEGNVTTDKIDFAALDGTIDFADNVTLTGKLDATTADKGTVNFAGTGKITDKIGDTARIKAININGAADTEVTFSEETNTKDLTIKSGTLTLTKLLNVDNNLTFTEAGKITVGGALTLTEKLVFTKDGTLTLKGANNAHVITKEVEISSAESLGTVALEGSGALTFTKAIGETTSDKALKLLDLNGTGLTTLTADAHIEGVKFSAAGALQLDKATGKYKIHGATATTHGKGKININEDVTLEETGSEKAHATFGTKDAKIGELHFLNAANKTLTIEDNIDIYTTKLTTAAAGEGSITFKGNSVFSSAFDTNKIKQIEAIGKDSSVALQGALQLNNDLIISDTTTVCIDSDFTADNYKGAADGNGILKFNNANAITITGTVSPNNNSLQLIEIYGGNVTFANKFETHKGDGFKFTSDSDAKLVFADNTSTIQDQKFINEGKGKYTVELPQDTIFASTLGAPDKQINFDLKDKTATIGANADASGANFINATNQKGKLDLNAADAVVNSAGTADKTLEEILFSENGTITKNAYAKETKIDPSKTGSLGGVIGGGKVTLLGATNTESTAIFLDGASIESTIETGTTKFNNITFNGNVTINKDIGASTTKFNQVNFNGAAGKIASLNSDIHTTNIALGAMTLSVDSNATLNSNLTATNSTFALGSNKLTVKNNTLEFASGTNNITFEITKKGDSLSGGSITIDSNSKLKLATDAKLNITPDDYGNNGNMRPKGGKTIEYVLIKNDGALASSTKINLDNITLNDSKNQFTKWAVGIANDKSIALYQTDNSLAVLTATLGSDATTNDKTNIAKLSSAAADTDGDKVIGVLHNLNTDKKQVSEALDRLTNPEVATNSVTDTVTSVGSNMSTRMNNFVSSASLGSSVQTADNGNISGFAAGDMPDRYGAWFSPFYSSVTQKANKSSAGYKGESFGGSFGFDTRANDDLLVGAALSVGKSEIKYKDLKSGDKTKVGSVLLTLYSMQNVANNCYIQGSVTFGTNDVQTDKKRLTGLAASEVVRGKYKAMSFNSDVMFGYNYVTDQATITPIAGLRYIRTNDGGYKETGSKTGQNLSIAANTANKLEAVAGLRLSGGNFDVNGVSLTPEVYGFVNHDFMAEKSKTKATIGGVDSFSTPSRKAMATHYNLGAGLNAKYGMMEYGANYDLNIAEKRTGHQGSLRIRVNF